MIFNVRSASARGILTPMSAACPLFGVTHQLGDFFNADRRYLIAEVCAVVVPEDMGGQIRYDWERTGATGGMVHFYHDRLPHLDIR